MTAKKLNNKGQLSIEAAIILLFMLAVLASIWLGGPIQQSTEKSVDTNGIILAAKTLDTIASAVETVGIAGAGQRQDFVIHVPFNTVDIQYNDTPFPHINITVLLYNNLSEGGFGAYEVDLRGRPSWYKQVGESGPFDTSFYYKTITKELKYPLVAISFPLCEESARKPADEIRGPSTQLYFIRQNPLTPSVDEQHPLSFCCEAGFNLHMYLEKSSSLNNPSDAGELRLKARHYYSLPGDWVKLA
jgi:uncharacterized protein (UPF0333 family)